MKFKAVGEGIKETFVPEDNVPPVAATGLHGFLAKFTVLKGAQRELWLTFLIKFLIYTAYSITNKTMVLWLSKDLCFNDQAAGAVVSWVLAPASHLNTVLAGVQTAPASRPGGWWVKPAPVDTNTALCVVVMS